MDADLLSILKKEMESIKEQGLFKEERIISSPQGREITVQGRKLLNFCANNYLGLGNNQELIAAGKQTLDQWGFGLSSVRFICGTQEIHKALEQKIAQFMGTEDAMLYSSCFDANGGLFQTFLGEEDAIITDALNHASIIDGTRLSKAERFIFKHMDMLDLEEKLKAAQGKRLRLIATDGVFSMDGDIAPLGEICDLAKTYNALVMVDDAHATGFVGATGRGTHEYRNVMGKVDFITSTLGKALGGASGGFLAAKKEIIDFFRQRSRTYLFSNSLAPVITGVSIATIGYIQEHPELREKLWENTKLFRKRMQENGFKIPEAEHPIVPIMIGDAKIAKDMAKQLFELGLYVIAFSYPVVPQGTARIRVQISAGHTKEDIEKAVELFTLTAKNLGVLTNSK